MASSPNMTGASPQQSFQTRVPSPTGPDFDSSAKAHSGEATCVNLTALKDDSNGDIVPEYLPKEAAEEYVTHSSKLSQRMKWTLMFIFSLAFFIDVLSYSAFFVLTREIAIDLEVDFDMQSWIITSYSVTFASFLLLFGRVSDLYSAKPVFSYGFLALGILNLIISFLPEKFSFFILRALSGIAGACLLPASYRLIAHVFEPHELGQAYTVYGMVGGISNVMGVIVAGFVGYIPGHGQMIAWRWFFRIVAMIVIPFSLLAFFIVPYQKGEDSDDGDSKLRRLDLVGAFLILSAIILLTLGLTLGASHGWRTAGFLVPFLLSFVLFPSFFYWEHRIGESRAMIPSKTWKVPNFALFIMFSLPIYPWWGINFLGFIETWTTINHERPIIAAVRTLPQGLVSLVVAGVLTSVPTLLARPRWTVATGQLLGVVGYIIMTRPTYYVGTNYWRYLFPAFLIGSAGNMAAFTGTNVAIMTSVPAEMSGVTGAILQVGLQLGGTIAFAVQAGMLTVNPGGLENPENLRASLYFQMGWAALWLIMFLAFYRNPKQPISSTTDSAEQGRVEAPEKMAS